MTIWSFLIRWIHCPLVLVLRVNPENVDTVALLFKGASSSLNQISAYISLPRSRNSFDVIFTKLNALTLFRMGFFGAAHGWGSKKVPSLKSVIHILQWWNLAQLYLTQRRSKNYINHVTHPLRSADISIFSSEISKICYNKKYRYRLYFDI